MTRFWIRRCADGVPLGDYETQWEAVEHLHELGLPDLMDEWAPPLSWVAAEVMDVCSGKVVERVRRQVPPDGQHPPEVMTWP